ncbi:hypothetical protein Tco_1014040, partial [Tanacetum coccineum]
MASYTRSCIIRMKTTEDLMEFLGNGPYMVDRLKIEVEEYKGYEHHKDTLKGIFKLTIFKMEVDEEEEMHKSLQNLFQGLECTNIDIQKNGKPDGTAKLRFKTEEGRSRAMILVKRHGFNWKLKISP